MKLEDVAIEKKRIQEKTAELMKLGADMKQERAAWWGRRARGGRGVEFGFFFSFVYPSSSFPSPHTTEPDPAGFESAREHAAWWGRQYTALTRTTTEPESSPPARYESARASTRRGGVVSTPLERSL